MKNLKTIDQSGIASLVAERMNNPAQYVERPLVIWRSHYRDGVLEGLLCDVARAYNENKPRKGKRMFWVIDVDDENKSSDYFSNPVVLGFYVVQPASARSASFVREKMREIGEKFGVPVICFMPCDATDVFPSVEQYLFEPDFEQWAARYAIHSEIMDFIRGDGDKAGITYRWYNAFSTDNPAGSKGCSMPEYWLDGRARLGFIRRIVRAARLCDISEEDFRKAFSEGISDDLVADFREYIMKKNI